jgi:CopG family transcriptional regulator, nickel-responsive regulator
MERITISIDDQLALRFDALIARRGYGSRSEAVRDLVREALELERQQHDDDTLSFGVLTYVYNHHERELASRITRAQHEHHHLALSTLHVHVDPDNCLESVVLRGPTRALRSFSDALCASTGVRHGHLQLLPGELTGAGHHHDQHEQDHGPDRDHGHGQ